MAQISVKKDNEEKVLCPHCGAEITEVIGKNVSGGIITTKTVYACGKCRKVIPVSHSTYAF